MTSLPDTRSEPLLKVLHRPSLCGNVFRGGLLFMTDPVVLNASTHRSIVCRSGIAPRRSTKNFRQKRCWTVTTESLFLRNCSTANTRCSTFQCAMATETALSELSAGLSRTSSIPPLPSTSHLKKMRFLCSTLYNCDSSGCNDSMYELHHYEPNIVTKAQGGEEYPTYSTTKEG